LPGGRGGRRRRGLELRPDPKGPGGAMGDEWLGSGACSRRDSGNLLATVLLGRARGTLPPKSEERGSARPPNDSELPPQLGEGGRALMS